MIITGNYSGCRIFIQDDTLENAVTTTIIKHDKLYKTILVKDKIDDFSSVGFVNLLIVSSNEVHEYRGKLRKISATTTNTEIALFNGQKKKESRFSKRYIVNKQAIVKSLVIARGLIPLLNPLNIHIENLSSSGALIRANPNCFAINSVLELTLDIGDSPTVLYGKIVRQQAVDDDTVNYGCKFISIK